MQNLYDRNCYCYFVWSKNNCEKLIFIFLLPLFVMITERHGSRLNDEELGQFECLRDDYEINWHLKQIRSAISPTLEEKHLRSVTVKNRRRAFLNKLIHDGQYFSEDAMREREPYLHHEYVGKFQDPVGRGISRPGERWSETLMRRAEENMITSQIRKEQERLGVPKKDWVGPKEEEEVEEEEEEESDEEMVIDRGGVASPSVKVQSNETIFH